MTRRSQRHRRLFLTLTIALILFWSAGLLAFLRALPDGVDDNATATDAIVVLTGGSLRLKTGLTLLQEGLAERLFVSGVHRGVDVQQLLRIARQSPDAAECCISLGHEADDTTGNAAETSAWMAKHGYRSMRLVTAAYHMPRSLIEFRNTMPDVQFHGSGQLITFVLAFMDGREQLRDEAWKMTWQRRYVLLVGDGRLDGAAIAVTHDDDQWRFQDGDGVFEAGDHFTCRQVAGYPADEKLTDGLVEDDLGGDTRIGTSNDGCEGALSPRPALPGTLEVMLEHRAIGETTVPLHDRLEGIVRLRDHRG